MGLKEKGQKNRFYLFLRVGTIEHWNTVTHDAECHNVTHVVHSYLSDKHLLAQLVGEIVDDTINYPTKSLPDEKTQWSAVANSKTIEMNGRKLFFLFVPLTKCIPASKCDFAMTLCFVQLLFAASSGKK